MPSLFLHSFSLFLDPFLLSLVNILASTMSVALCLSAYYLCTPQKCVRIHFGAVCKTLITGSVEGFAEA